MGDILLAHFGPLSTTAYLSIFADHVHPFMTTVTSLDVKLLFVFNICIHSVLCISMLYCMLSCVHLFPSLFLAALDWDQICIDQIQ